MKGHAVLPALIAILLASTPAAAKPADLSGSWKVRNDIAGNVSEMTCTFTQKEADLTGGCVTEQATVEITGKVEEGAVNWVFRSTYNGGPITLTYKGTVGSDGGITGNVTVEEFSVTGDFTATQAPK
jgi:hypothetical protein